MMKYESLSNKSKIASSIMLILFIISILSACTKAPLPADAVAAPEVVNEKPSFGLYPAYIYKGNNKLWGMIDNTGSFVVEASYKQVEDFQENGLARIYANDSFGLINSNGSVVIEPKYQYLSNYSEGIAIALDNNKYYAIDEDGKVMFETDDYIGDFKNGIAWAQRQDALGNMLYGYIDKTGKYIIEPKYLYAGDFVDGKTIVRPEENKYEVIDSKGNVLYSTNDKVLYELSDDVLVYYDKAKSLYGYMSLNGNIIIEAEFDYAGKFVDGHGIVSKLDSYNEQKFGVIDTKGQYVIKPEYASVDYLGENMFAVSMNSMSQTFDMFANKAVADDKGNIITEYKYYDMGIFNNGILSVCDGSNTYFIDKSGKELDNMPKVKGAGVLKVYGNIIKAEVDDDIAYYNGDNSILWQPDSVIRLDSGIEVNIVKYRPDRCLLVRYPEFTNLPDKSVQDTMNQELKAYFIGDQTESIQEEGLYQEDVTVDFTVEDINDLLIIKMDAYIYPIGAAHGQQIRRYLHMNKQNGKLYILEDMFKKNSDYEKRLVDIINKKIKDDDSKGEGIYELNTIDSLMPEQDFTVSEDALTIYFQPYDIAAYAAGFPTFRIPYNAIMDIIDVNGEFWKTFKK